jgi:hexosaminidase
VYRSAQLYTDHVINPGMASTYAFIDHVVGQLVALHRQAGVPLRRLHVGGDELPNGAWEKSPASAALMKQQGLAGMAELWDHFYTRVDTILRRHGLAGAGWEELGARKVKLRGQDKLIPNPRFVDRDFHLYVWNDTEGAEDLAYRLANAGYKAVLAPATHLYFDMAHNQNPEEWGVNWASLVDLDKVFDFIPFDFVRKGPLDATPLPGRDGLTDFGQRHILGLEATLFTETMRETSQIDHLLMPRLLAMAERAWVADPAWAREANPAKAQVLHDADWSVFVQQLGQRVLPRLALDRPDVLFRIPPPGLKQVDGQVHVNHQLPGLTLRFTLDDSEPNATSTVLAATPLGDKKIIRVAAFDARGRSGPSVRIDNRFDNR